MSAEHNDPPTKSFEQQLLAEATRWYYAERVICGHPDHTPAHARCVLSPLHDGPHDPLYEATWQDRLRAWLDQVLKPSLDAEHGATPYTEQETTK